MPKKNFIIFITLVLMLATPDFALGKNRCCKMENPEYSLKFPVIKNDDISGIQKALKELGLYDGKITGLYNWETEQAVEKFQKSVKIPASGKFGSETRKKLIIAYEGVPQNTPESPKGNVTLIVDVDNKIITVLVDNKSYKTYPVAVGKISTPSPIGNWSIDEIDHWPGGPFGSVWMAIRNPWGNYGIHGTDRPWSIGSNASGGCIRMNNHDVLELSKWVKNSTPVKVIGTPYSPYYEERRNLHGGMNGADVREVQRSLFEKGYYKYKIDGMWSWRTEKAISQFQKDHGFKDTGVVDEDMYAALGL